MLKNRRSKIVAGAAVAAALVVTPVAIAVATPDGGAGEPGALRSGTGQGSAAVVETGTVPEGAHYVEPEQEELQPLYDEQGRLLMDAQGNHYGLDGALVRDPEGNCVQGLAPGTPPDQNICFDPSLVPDPSEFPGSVTWDVTVAP